MQKELKREGICRICGEHKRLTFEHVPPQSAFNSNPVFFKNRFIFTIRKVIFTVSEPLVIKVQAGIIYAKIATI